MICALKSARYFHFPEVSGTNDRQPRPDSVYWEYFPITGLIRMAWNLYAHCDVPRYDGSRMTTQNLSRVLIGSYDSKQLAQWWSLNIKRVYIDSNKTLTVPEHRIMFFETIEE